jgi:hypothetical protein
MVPMIQIDPKGRGLMNRSDRIVTITNCDGEPVARGIVPAGSLLSDRVATLAAQVHYPETIAAVVSDSPDWTGRVVWGDGDIIVTRLPERTAA